MISVCMATFNGANFITEQLNSILEQLSKCDEIIISDDGSTDETLAIIASYEDKRIKVFTDGGARNPIFNFEYALSKASGEYLFLCDQDDVWLPNKIDVCISLLKKYELVISDCKVINLELDVIQDSFFKYMSSGLGLIKNLKRNTYLGCCMCFRRSLLKLIIPFPKKIPMHDVWIGFVAELFCKVKFEPQPLVLYRRHGNNVSSTAEKSTKSLVKKIIFRINLIICIPLLIIRKFCK